MKFYLETERLILREFRESETEGIFELDSNAEVHKYLGKNPITTYKQAEDIITFFEEQYKERGIGRFAAFEKASGDFIGWSGLKLNQGEKESLNGFTNFIDIGYRFIPRFWGKGFASEAAFACLDFGFNEMNYDIIYGAADVENIGSNKILQKIGLQFINQFGYKGVDVNWYELKKTDYEQ
ncbi:GNAT family N-acetyltransferase [Tenacibaculum sp. 1B UA]|uniref:GNAT family N-acetyltransferase n=1 Tax=unclassified Tenacibaculum TaxID=2635139 RepID=UPI0026E3DA4B|nr:MULTISPECIES: GNAT family N-acetyltransferase [unclassified Tenacibaculum]MDO6674354.1 GNAT family N-acetyltransferase [Tenacibaculum sp. 1_MG-2023]MDX8552105.1 GNAT family N-acetyltransferase [Tenacibaculum sp. 1B UA]